MKPKDISKFTDIRLCIAVLAALLAGSVALASQHTVNQPDAAASDPAKLGWMVGSPPPAE